MEFLMTIGSLFHTVGPAWAKARSPLYCMYSKDITIFDKRFFPTWCILVSRPWGTDSCSALQHPAVGQGEMETQTQGEPCCVSWQSYRGNSHWTIPHRITPIQTIVQQDDSQLHVGRLPTRTLPIGPAPHKHNSPPGWCGDVLMGMCPGGELS